MALALEKPELAQVDGYECRGESSRSSDDKKYETQEYLIHAKIQGILSPFLSDQSYSRDYRNAAAVRVEDFALRWFGENNGKRVRMKLAQPEGVYVFSLKSNGAELGLIL